MKIELTNVRRSSAIKAFITALKTYVFRCNSDAYSTNFATVS